MDSRLAKLVQKQGSVHVLDGRAELLYTEDVGCRNGATRQTRLRRKPHHATGDRNSQIWKPIVALCQCATSARRGLEPLVDSLEDRGKNFTSDTFISAGASVGTVLLAVTAAL